MEDHVANMDPMERAQIELGNKLEVLKKSEGYEEFLDVVRSRFDEAFEAILVPSATEINIWEAIGALKLSRKLETALDEEISKGRDAQQRYLARYEATARSQQEAMAVEPAIRAGRHLGALG